MVALQAQQSRRTDRHAQLLAHLGCGLSAETKGELTKLGGKSLRTPRKGANGRPEPLGEDCSFTAWIGTKETTDVELHLDSVASPGQIAHPALIAAMNTT